MPSLEVIRGTESQQRQIVSEAAGRTTKLQLGSFDEPVPVGTQRRWDNLLASMLRHDIISTSI